MELSIEEKAQRYDEAIEQLRAMMPNWERLSYTGKTFLQDLTYILPELQESEDEMIRRVLIQETKGSEERLFEAVTNEEFIAWLEKKGEQILTNSAKTCKDEQKPNAKVEPKFKVGDWIANDYCVGKIIALTDGAYLLESEQGVPFSCEHNAHLWTIQDAEDGDVLAFNDGHGNDCIELIKSITGKKIEFWFCLTNGNSYEAFDGNLPYTNLASRKDATPATKEQRDLLFAKMKQAEYEWDAEKKELKKIEDEPDKCEGCNNAKGCVACVDGSEWAHIEEHNPAWSEEDDRTLAGIIEEIEANKSNAPDYDIPVYDRFLSFLKSIKERVQPQPQQEWSEEDENAIGMAIIALDDLYDEDSPDTTYGGYNLPFNKAAERLKSLKEKYTWKPSEHELEVLKLAAEKDGTCLMGLYKQLKKLREE